MNPLHALMQLIHGPQAMQGKQAPTQPLQYAQINKPNGNGGNRNNSSQLQVQRPQQGGMPNLGVGFHNVQGGMQNPGFTPMQNSGFGPGGNPQIRAFNSPHPQTFDPQANQDGYTY